MSSWSRAKDAWIARECEGLDVRALDVSPSGERCAFWVWSLDAPNHPVSHYLTDPAAAIRAAEAWAAKDKDHRTWSLHRAGTLLGQCTDDGHHYIHEGEDGLCWALYDATGGPE